MIKIAAVEDNPEEAARLKALLERYFAKANAEFSLTVFDKPLVFLSGYRPEYDIVFMDIELPGMDGMDAAHRLREVDQKVILIFVTKMAQFAVKGYEVNAMDYLLKPLEEELFAAKMDRALARLADSAQVVLITSQGGAQRLLLQNISYIEVRSHTLFYHTDQGVVSGGGTLSDVENELHAKGFLRCSKCYLVNARRVVRIRGFELQLDDGQTLQISRLRKSDFMTELAEAVGKL